MTAAHRRHDMTEDVWERLKPHLPGGEGKRGRPAQDNRRFIDAVCWILRTGAPWRDLPPDYGDWKNTHRPPRSSRLTGVCIGFHVGAWRVTSRSDLGSGQGSGSSHTRLQNRPRCSNHLSQAMPYRITLTVRPGFSRLLR